METLNPVTRGCYSRNQLEFTAVPGTTYTILVGAEGGAYGDLALNLYYAATPPTNDDFATATSLEGETLTISGSNAAATRESGEPSESRSSGHSVWFSWTAPTGTAESFRPLVVSTAGSNIDPILNVYEGDALDLLTAVSVTTNATRGESPRASFIPKPGVRYIFSMDGNAATQSPCFQEGNYVLDLDYSPVNLTALDVEGATNPDQTVTIAANLHVRNHGPSRTGPLRVRVAAHAARSRAGLHFDLENSQTNLTDSADLFRRGLNSGEQSTQFPILIRCPGPLIRSDATNVWGVYAFLEEQIADAWVITDRTFLGYGEGVDGDDGGLNYGIGRPAPPVVSSVDASLTIFAYDIITTNFLNGRTDDLQPGSTNQLLMLVQFLSSELRVASEVDWTTSPPLDLTPTGSFAIPAFPLQSSLTVTGLLHFNSRVYSQVRTFHIVSPPTLSATMSANSATLILKLTGASGERYQIETTTALPGGWEAWGVVRLPHEPLVLPLSDMQPHDDQFFRARLLNEPTTAR
ncbi:MAG: hypothetical protein JNK85_29730 [Verrucomicrobiales bacterium]|nr:hypothetical protein [Verrucomicrobiales bacterium]